METKRGHEETERRVRVMTRNARMAEHLNISVLIMHDRDRKSVITEVFLYVFKLLAPEAECSVK